VHQFNRGGFRVIRVFRGSPPRSDVFTSRRASRQTPAGEEGVALIRFRRAAQDPPIGGDSERAGFVVVSGGKGSHRKFRHSKMPGALILSGQSGDEAQHYQERQVRKAIREASR